MVSYRGEANVISQLLKNWESQRLKENERKENWRTDIAERLTHMLSYDSLIMSSNFSPTVSQMP